MLWRNIKATGVICLSWRPLLPDWYNQESMLPRNPLSGYIPTFERIAKQPFSLTHALPTLQGCSAWSDQLEGKKVVQGGLERAPAFWSLHCSLAGSTPFRPLLALPWGFCPKYDKTRSWRSALRPLVGSESFSNTFFSSSIRKEYSFCLVEGFIDPWPEQHYLCAALSMMLGPGKSFDMLVINTSPALKCKVGSCIREVCWPHWNAVPLSRSGLWECKLKTMMLAD